MTKRTQNVRRQSCKTSCLACTFFSICKLLLDKKRKKKKKENCCHSRKFFPLLMKCFLIFAKVFYVKFVPKITIRESFCQKFRDFLILRKFLLAKVSAPKVDRNSIKMKNLLKVSMILANPPQNDGSLKYLRNCTKKLFYLLIFSSFRICKHSFY